ncbi:hypothetical protein HDV05_001699 [Chytridiales sp. JEL 0842]|nr:hypothetical protein HDV05_001699 [Chytridiales sp. JEL 0842]
MDLNQVSGYFVVQPPYYPTPYDENEDEEDDDDHYSSDDGDDQEDSAFSSTSLILSNTIPDLSTTDSLIEHLKSNLPSYLNLHALQNAISSFETHIKSTENPSFQFQTSLLPSIISFATDARFRPTFDRPKEYFLLKQGESKSLILKAGEILCLLANAFLLKTAPQPRAGSLDLRSLYSCGQPEGMEKIKCLLAYFYHHATSQDTQQDLEMREIVFERVSYDVNELSGMLDEIGNVPVVSITESINIHVERMESVPSDAFADFANRNVHVHKVIPTCAQEEILFACAPELFATILIFETFANSECAVVHNIKRTSDYTGYMRTFKFHSILLNSNLQSILLMDATNTRHFTKPMVDRDISKAVKGFSTAIRNGGAESISTGHWGCGVFRGDKYHKFLQQVLAFRLATFALETGGGGGGDGEGCVLHYSCYKDEGVSRELKGWIEELNKGGVGVKKLYEWLVGYDPVNGCSFRNYMKEMVESLAGAGGSGLDLAGR